jgi:hypothetical protein
MLSYMETVVLANRTGAPSLTVQYLALHTPLWKQWCYDYVKELISMPLFMLRFSLTNQQRDWQAEFNELFEVDACGQAILNPLMWRFVLCCVSQNVNGQSGDLLARFGIASSLLKSATQPASNSEGSDIHTHTNDLYHSAVECFIHVLGDVGLYYNSTFHMVNKITNLTKLYGSIKNILYVNCVVFIARKINKCDSRWQQCLLLTLVLFPPICYFVVVLLPWYTYRPLLSVSYRVFFTGTCLFLMLSLGLVLVLLLLMVWISDETIPTLCLLAVIVMEKE